MKYFSIINDGFIPYFSVLCILCPGRNQLKTPDSSGRKFTKIQFCRKKSKFPSVLPTSMNIYPNPFMGRKRFPIIIKNALTIVPPH